MTDPGTEAAPEVPRELYDRMVEIRRDLHRHPELSFKEARTAERVASHLTELGLRPVLGVGGTGVVADMPGSRDGPRVALRVDLDALPVQEETGLPFASERPGVMHACGHDGHTAMLLGAAELLVREPPPLPVRLIFQPAEELAAGAKKMVEAGVLEGVGMIFGGHVDRHHAPGTLVVTEGSVQAAADAFAVDIRGKGGHGARPHEAVDAVVVGSLLVTALQTIVSREVDPTHPSVLSVCSFHAGTAANVIADTATLEGTIRCQDLATRDHLHRSLDRICHAIGQLHGADVSVRITAGTPPVINTADMTAIAREAAAEVVGDERVEPLRRVNMGGEDFACFLTEVPGAYIRFGARVEGREGYPAHSSRFDFHERALATGAAWLDRVARLAGERLSRGR